MLQTLKAIKNEHVVSIKELQKSPSRHLKGITRILRGKKTIGYFLDERAFENFLEDIEAMHSPNFLKRIANARKSKTFVTLEEIEKEYGIV